jgi:sulfite exporter TauE/SafE
MLYTAILMGLAGSLHCAGMCSPLAMAVTKNNPFFLSSILYNSGRIFIYALLGTLAAALGSFIHLSSYQWIISITLGGAFIIVGLGFDKIRLPLINKGIVSLTSNLKRVFGVALSRKSKATTFILGMINGMLPCGLTYLALSACLILPSASDGFLFMIFFGLGTWPVMVGLTKLINFAILKSGFSWSRFSKIAMVLIGCTLLLRVWWTPHANNHSTKSLDQVTVCK